MATESWVVSVSATASNGNVTQLYPAYAAAGVAKSGSTLGQFLRGPIQGALHSIQVRSDGANAGVIEIYDINGEDWGADVSSGTTITDTQLDAAIAAGQAKLLFIQDVPTTSGTGVVTAPGIYRSFMKGLAARFVAGGGACTLNLVAEGGHRRTRSLGGY